MKVLKKTSFEYFEELSVAEAAQLYGGDGECKACGKNPCQCSSSDSTHVSKPKPTYEVTIAPKIKNGTPSITLGGSMKTKRVTLSIEGSVSTKDCKNLDGGFGFTLKFKFGGGK